MYSINIQKRHQRDDRLTRQAWSNAVDQPREIELSVRVREWMKDRMNED